MLGALALIGVLFVVANFVVPGSVNGKSLSHSIFDEMRFTTEWNGRECVQQGDSEWSCEVGAADEPGSYTYSVAVDGKCWDAKLSHRPTGVKLTTTQQPKQIAGCVKLDDNLRVLDSF